MEFAEGLQMMGEEGRDKTREVEFPPAVFVFVSVSQEQVSRSSEPVSSVLVDFAELRNITKIVLKHKAG